MSNIVNGYKQAPTFTAKVGDAYLNQTSPVQQYPNVFDPDKHEIIDVAPMSIRHLQALYFELDEASERGCHLQTSNGGDNHVPYELIIKQRNIVIGLLNMAIVDFAKEQSKNSGLFMITENWMIVSVRPDTNVNHAPSGKNINKQHSRFSTLQANAA